jgi:thiol:disulfide interchange protein DsbD
MKKIGLLLLLFFVAGQAPASESSSWRRGQGRAFADPFLGKFLPVNKAFKASAWRSDEWLYVRFLNAPGYYLHRHSFILESRGPAVSVDPR